MLLELQILNPKRKKEAKTKIICIFLVSTRKTSIQENVHKMQCYERVGRLVPFRAKKQKKIAKSKENPRNRII